MSQHRPVPLLRCFAGDLPIGLAAEEVEEFRTVQRDRPHISTLLGVRPGPADEAQRTLLLTTGEDSALITVDGPVRIRALVAGEVLRLPPFLARMPIEPLLGFAEQDGRIVLLLDVPSVARLASLKTRAGSQGKQSC
jgi:hypothetical protein